MIVGLVNVDDTPHHTLLGSIDYTFDFVPLTIFIVKIYTPNDMGDIRVTLKIDHIGTIDVTMKHTIIEGQDFSPYMTDIHIGSVLVLQEISFLFLLISYFLCCIEFIFLLN
ncbi:hypothetical protein GmHk_06G017335 [Glycine max]|nr:hypothetical protein GmHk_06G017335 [Glycine max]